jgi:prevent-host-death family protein
MKVTVHEAKTNLSRLLERAARGEDIVIARGTKPVARLVPIGELRGKRQPGSMQGEFVVGPEFFAPLPDEEIAGWE